MGQPNTVLIVDDHVLFRQGLSALLGSLDDLAVVGEAADGHEALQKASELQPDVILMDIQLPGLGGIEATRRVRQTVPRAQVVVVTAVSDDPSLIYQAIKAGAIGYVPKSSDFQELARAVRHAAAGQAAMPAAALTGLVSIIGGKAQAPSIHGRSLAELSQREREVLELVADGLTNRQIAQRLVISESTVHSHFHNVLDKLRVTSRVQAAALALEARRSAPAQGGRASSALTH